MNLFRKMFKHEPKRPKEVNSGVPVEMPLGYNRGSDLHAKVAAMVRREISMYAESQGQETFEEADDFDVPDELPEFDSPYEEHFDHVENYHKLREEIAEAKKKKAQPKAEPKSSVTEEKV